MKTPITYYGGKQMLVPEILPLIPEHITYCEPFLGGGAVFFSKTKSEVEIINDTNRFVVNFYRQAKTNFHALSTRIESTPHSRDCYRDALVMYERPHMFDNLDKAWAFWMLCNQGYSGKIGTWGFGTVVQSCERRLMNARRHFGAGEIVDRLEKVQIECHDALYVLTLRDRPTTFFYLDPPYYNSNMGHYGGYTEADFEALLKTCSLLQGRFLLSSYPSDLLDRYTKEHGWRQIEIQATVTASSKRKPKTEVLTANYPIDQLRAAAKS